MKSIDELVKSVYKEQQIAKLIVDYIECVKLSWVFPGVYDLTLERMRKELEAYEQKLPPVLDALAYLRKDK